MLVIEFQKLANGFTNRQIFIRALEKQMNLKLKPENRNAILGKFKNGVLLKVVRGENSLEFILQNEGCQVVRELLKARRITIDDFSWN